MKVIFFIICLIFIEFSCKCQHLIIDPIQQNSYDVKIKNNSLIINELEEKGQCFVELKIVDSKLEEFLIKRLMLKNLKNNNQFDCVDKSCLEYENYQIIQNKLIHFFQKNLIISKLTSNNIAENKNILIKIN